MSTQREQFEDAIAPPQNVWWSGERGRYIGVSGNHTQCAMYQGQWEGWRERDDQGRDLADIAYLDGYVRGHGAAQQAQGEPIGCYSVDDDGDIDFDRCLLWLEKYPEKYFPVYAHPQPAQQVPPGWRAVPCEPTPEMVEAAEEAHMPFGDMALAIQCANAEAPKP